MRYSYVPPAPDSRLDHVGTYKRTLPVSLQRMYENTLDWQHLAHLHSSSFQQIHCLDSGAWGWRAEVTGANGGKSLLELSLDRSCRRWITRNLEGPNEGAEIWTHVFVEAPRQLDIVVDFFVPGVALEAREKVGYAYARQYEILYDEDVEMMTQRQHQIDQRIKPPRSEDKLQLTLPEARALPLQVELSGQQFMLNQFAGEWVVYPAVCPHQMGPLTGDISASGEVHCPWHGYTFDVISGDCTSGGSCRFGRIPGINLTSAGLELSWAAAGEVPGSL